MVVTPSSRWISRIWLRNDTRILASSAESGSSSRSMLRLRCPERGPAIRAAADRPTARTESAFQPLQPNQLKHLLDAARELRPGPARHLEAESNIVRQRSYSGKVRRPGRPCRCAAGSGAAPSRRGPRSDTARSGCSNPATIRRTVVLPQPGRTEEGDKFSLLTPGRSPGRRVLPKALTSFSSVERFCAISVAPAVGFGGEAGQKLISAHGAPGHDESDDRQRRRLVGPICAHDLQVRPEGRAD